MHFFSGTLSDTESALFEEHVDQCAACRGALSALAQGESAAPGLIDDAAQISVAEGLLVARYLLQEQIGRGAMGYVYRAQDPELGRELAIKLIAVAEGDSQRLQRALHEGRALARIAHPNVVTVHDVGLFAGGVFVAMELVEGQPLSDRLGEEASDWRETCEIFLQVAQGLAAAHRAGVVHRDIKPSNLLLGTDGRVRVGDFGLAFADVAEMQDALAKGSPLESPLRTATDVVLGTPAYMAPETRRGERSDEKSDQYSFCVAMWEALCGSRPGEGDALFPRHLRKVLERGLANDPEQRFASMAELAAALQRRRRWPLVGLAGLVLAALAAALLFWPTSRSDSCSQVASVMQETWNPDRQQSLGRRFAATKLPYSATAFERVSASADSFSRQWSTLRKEACRQPEQYTRVAALCLERKRAELDLVLALLETRTNETIERASSAVARLGVGADCLHGEAAASEPPEVQALAQRLSEWRARKLVGSLEKPTEDLNSLIAELESTEGAALPLADAYLQLGWLHIARADSEAAQNAFLQAVQLADAAKLDEVRVKAWIDLAHVIGTEKSDFDEAMRLLELAEGALKRIGRPPALVAKLHEERASTYLIHGDGQSAEKEAREALSEVGQEAENEVNRRSLVAQALQRVGRYEEAVAELENTLRLVESNWGKAHPKTAGVLVNLMPSLMYLGRDREALEHLLRAQSIYVEMKRESLAYATTLDNMAIVYARLGDLEKALKHGEEALAMRKRLPGGETFEDGASYVNLGWMEMQQGDAKAASIKFERGLKILEDHLEIDHPHVASALIGLAAAYLELKRNQEAVQACERALAISIARKIDPAQIADTKYRLATALVAHTGVTSRVKKLLGEALQGLANADPSGSAAQIREFMKRHGIRAVNP